MEMPFAKRTTLGVIRMLPDGLAQGLDRLRGLAAPHACESMVPDAASEKIRGLSEHYGIEGSPATDYFEVHRTLDVEHAAETREALAARLEAGDDPRSAEEGAEIPLDAVWTILDGVCRVHGIERAA